MSRMLRRTLRLPSSKRLLRLMKDIQGSSKSAFRVARDNGCTLRAAQKLIAGLRAQPAPKPEQPDVYVKFVKEICERCPRLAQHLHASDSADSRAAVVSFVAVSLDMFFQNADKNVRDYAAFHLVQAVDLVRREQAAQWTH